MTTCQAPNLQALIERAQTDLFVGVAKDQRHQLAEAWSNFRCSAALLAEVDHGRVPTDHLRDALERAQAGIEALLALTGTRTAAGAG